MEGPLISKPFFKDHYHKKIKRFDVDGSEERGYEMGYEMREQIEKQQVGYNNEE